MSDQLRSQQMIKRLHITMLVVLIAFIGTSCTMMIDAYERYEIRKQALAEIQLLSMIADLANQISRERAFANKAMSSTPADLEQKKQELNTYRFNLDQHLDHTLHQIQALGFNDVVSVMNHKLKPSLDDARKKIDFYVDSNPQQRSAKNMYDAIDDMFKAWDQTYYTLQFFIKEAKGRDSTLSSYYTLILILADLRDQAGRVASHIMPSITFNQPIPSENLGLTFQSQRQTYYLWDLVAVIQPETQKSEKFHQLYHEVETNFIQKGIPIVSNLVQQSINHQPYTLTGTELTNAMVDHFTTVVNLQSYLLEQSVEFAESKKAKAQQQLIFLLSICLIALIAILATFLYIKSRIFNPLMQARNVLVDIVQQHEKNLGISPSNRSQTDQDLSLFEAIHNLKEMLKQRDLSEFELKNVANSDALIGLANRLALEDYIECTEQQPDQFFNTCLIVLDIDYFKQVNDQYGHLIGDQVIQQVSAILKLQIRTTDFVVRYGGDEFLILLPNTPMIRAITLAENIRLAVYEQKITVNDTQKSINISLSIGVASETHLWQDLMAKADKALFIAKAKGRNQVKSA